MERGPAREAAAAGQPVTQSGALDPATRTKKAESKAPLVPGLEFPRYFTLPGVDPFDEVEWEIRSAVIGNEKGKVVFEQRDVEIPKSLVPAGDQHRRLEVLPWPDRNA